MASEPMLLRLCCLSSILLICLVIISIILLGCFAGWFKNLYLYKKFYILPIVFPCLSTRIWKVGVPLKTPVCNLCCQEYFQIYLKMYYVVFLDPPRVLSKNLFGTSEM